MASQPEEQRTQGRALEEVQTLQQQLDNAQHPEVVSSLRMSSRCISEPPMPCMHASQMPYISQPDPCGELLPSLPYQ